MDVLAALVKALELVLGQVERVDLLDALGTDHARQGGKDTLLAILAGHERGSGKHGVLVVQHGGADARGGVGDGVFGALLALVGHIAALTRELLDLHVVKGVLVGVLGLKLVEVFAGDGCGLKGGKLAKAVLADHVGVDGLGAHADLLGDLGAQAGGVQAAARADDLLGIVAGQVHSSVHTTSQGLEMLTKMPSKPASTMRLAKVRAASVVKNSSPSRLRRPARPCRRR